MKKIDLIKATCYHEAGHAIVYHMLGIPIERIEAQYGNGLVMAKFVRPSYSLNKATKETLFKQLEAYGLVCLSGYCAEMKFQGKRLRGIMVINNGSPGNDNDLDCLLKEINIAEQTLNTNGKGSVADFYFAQLQQRTRRLIGTQKVWKSISELAEMLYSSEDRILLGEESHQLIDKYLKFGSHKLSKSIISYQDWLIELLTEPNIKMQLENINQAK